ncbi:ImmA/IrrE family metallo-endopeptidase [Bradyrhizobium sp. AUGA SZCCT0222]|uniref:ImmA/IrrE family metallo-endopeptidase n=1 Tax=Bradyrhizobium sp. AUGA SZCCT0222 TaxID=2807668 RepID=UPI001BA4A011|nr:ImmA/IrrE family metallo-endopeptidase [Bradyrhizobium sp. AUGA SZCCT0222]MBR1269689.1 ImmA/IrrE family metallo-endopeptidase [Bradyrhizobium sp. AUGA SZCCT0222]
MSDDYRDAPRQNSEVRDLAKRLRSYFGVADAERIDVLECAARDAIWTVKGIKPLRFDIVSDSQMPDDAGLTSYDGKTIIIQIARRIRHNAFMGDGFARNTVAHELGHAVMHFEKLSKGAVMARRSAGNRTHKWIPAYESAEHHAKVFAPAYLINETVARSITSIDEISVRFGISYSSAEIYFEQLQAEKERPAAAARFRRMVDDLIAPKQTPPKFLNDCCSVCTNQTVLPIGHKFMCMTCDTVYDRFQDGDQAQ